jgi:hypothetical protein
MNPLEMSNGSWASSSSSSSNSLLLTPSAESAPPTPPAINADKITEQVYKILFLDAEEGASKWEFLTTKAPFPVSKLVNNNTIMKLLRTTEPGPKVEYDGLSNNLALLKPYIMKTPSGPALLGFFKSLLQLRVSWLVAAANLEALRSYDRTLFTYYVEWYEAFRQDKVGREPDEVEIAYQTERQEHASKRASGFFTLQEQRLIEEVEAEAMKLVTFKTSQEMWKNSRILWTITEQYQGYRQTKKAVDAQKKLQAEEMKKRKTEEILQRRAEVKKKNKEVRKRQMGMQQQDPNNWLMQQDWMVKYLPGS